MADAESAGAFSLSEARRRNEREKAGRMTAFYNEWDNRWKERNGPPTEEDLKAAVGIWMGYPRLYEVICVFGDGWMGDSALYHEYHCLNGVHQEAAKLLVKAAESVGLDGSSIYTSAKICRELFYLHGMKCCSGRLYDPWPDCIARFKAELPADQRTAIQEGEAVLVRVCAKLQSAAAVPESLNEKLDRSRITQPEVSSAIQPEDSLTLSDGEPDDGLPPAGVTRRMGRRDHTFLKWYEDIDDSVVYHSHAGIRNRWNRLHPTRQIGDGDKAKGIDTVKKGIAAAIAERGIPLGKQKAR